MSDIIAARLVREQEFAYRLWRDHYTQHDLRRLSRLPVDQGGLGYELPASAFRGLVDGYRTTHDLGTVNREARIERQLDDVDLLTRAAGLALRRAEENAIVDEETGRSILAPYLDDKAAALLIKAQEREAKLLGLDAATKIEAEVTTYDGASAELAAMLAEVGLAQDAEA